MITVVPVTFNDMNALLLRGVTNRTDDKSSIYLVLTMRQAQC